MKAKREEHTSTEIVEICVEKQPSLASGTESKTSRAHAHWRSFLNRLKKKSFIRMPSLSPVMSRISRGKSRSARENVLAVGTFNSSWKNFSLVELQTATKNFANGLLLVPDL